ncbi:hypothetical protein BDF20DRAFT_471836 [Mycotypha africana]|uniref:uncharacterized protein n=1 Tax=Mycotypha africana TaxID=64632 RepID=UPI0022FFC51E|nr:uncharacterized protein BDF20DRAFT_471836 [Mycotypha africana]KAI8982433.1 hypothetical protein BDF20DRAFT_471836 [Mycotypha africana]
MSSYITNTRPSVFQRILHSFGLIELPIKVNCWYCCQDSFILPGSKNTVDHWYCHLCESNGEVVDPTPFETYKPPSENNAHTSSRLKSLKTLKNSNRSLCNSCQENQSLIYQLLSDYIPDESDPSYDFK